MAAKSLKSFDYYLGKLIKYCRETLDVYDSHKKTSKDNLILGYLNKFSKAYETIQKDKTIFDDDKSDFLDYFKEIYQDNKVNILKGINNVDWLSEGSIIVQYGKEILKHEKDKRLEKINIRLSIIYNTSLKLRDEMEEQLKTATADEYSRHTELRFHEVILMYLYRLFYYCAEKDEKEKVYKIAEELNKELSGGNEEEIKEAPRGMESFVADISKKAGGGDAIGTIQRILGNDKVRGTIDGLIQGAKTSTNLTDVLGNFMNTVTSEEFMKTVEDAKNNKTTAEVPTISESVGKLLSPLDIDKSKTGEILDTIGGFVDKFKDGTEDPGKILDNLINKVPGMIDEKILKKEITTTDGSDKDGTEHPGKILDNLINKFPRMVEEKILKKETTTDGFSKDSISEIKPKCGVIEENKESKKLTEVGEETKKKDIVETTNKIDENKK